MYFSLKCVFCRIENFIFHSFSSINRVCLSYPFNVTCKETIFLKAATVCCAFWFPFGAGDCSLASLSYIIPTSPTSLRCCTRSIPPRFPFRHYTPELLCAWDADGLDFGRANSMRRDTIRQSERRSISGPPAKSE